MSEMNCAVNATANTESATERIKRLSEEIENYKEMIDYAEGAMADAEHELAEELEEFYVNEHTEEDDPVETCETFDFNS